MHRVEAVFVAGSAVLVQRRRAYTGALDRLAFEPERKLSTMKKRYDFTKSKPNPYLKKANRQSARRKKRD